MVIDASALLALILHEPGHDVVRGAIAGGMVSSVNAAEIATALVRRGFPFDEVSTRIRTLPVSIADFDLELAMVAASLFPLTRSAGLSLGDRACLALAKREGLPVLSADRAWASIAPIVGVNVRMIR